MSKQIERLKKFYEFISQDEAIRDEFVAKVRADAKETMIEFAAKHGYELTAEDLDVTAEDVKVSREELDAIAGGSECFCFAGGGGTGNGEVWEHNGKSYGSLTCACVLGGGGEGDALDGSGRECRCYCLAVGSGEDGYYKP